jgi:hypothetical protein
MDARREARAGVELRQLLESHVLHQCVVTGGPACGHVMQDGKAAVSGWMYVQLDHVCSSVERRFVRDEGVFGSGLQGASMSCDEGSLTRPPQDSQRGK